jgi:hypothetical protein
MTEAKPLPSVEDIIEVDFSNPWPFGFSVSIEKVQQLISMVTSLQAENAALAHMAVKMAEYAEWFLAGEVSEDSVRQAINVTRATALRSQEKK